MKVDFKPPIKNFNRSQIAGWTSFKRSSWEIRMHSRLDLETPKRRPKRRRLSARSCCFQSKKNAPIGSLKRTILSGSKSSWRNLSKTSKAKRKALRRKTANWEVTWGVDRLLGRRNSLCSLKVYKTWLAKLKLQWRAKCHCLRATWLRRQEVMGSRIRLLLMELRKTALLELVRVVFSILRWTGWKRTKTHPLTISSSNHPRWRSSDRCSHLTLPAWPKNHPYWSTVEAKTTLNHRCLPDSL